jgi:cell division protein FtsB
MSYITRRQQRVQVVLLILMVLFATLAVYGVAQAWR